MFKQVKGVQLFYTDEETGIPLIVHHGGPGADHTLIAPFLADLRPDIRLICFDHRGTGKSSQPDETDGYKLNHFIHDLEGLRQELGITRMALMGHSFGGIVAQYYAVTYPEYLSHLILVCTASNSMFLEEGSQNLKRLVSAGVWQELEEISRQTPSEENMKRVFILQAPIFFKDPDMISSLNLDYVGWGPESQAVWQHLANFDVRPQITQIKVPTLVIGGKQDLAIPPAYSEQIAHLIPNACLTVLENCGHFPYIESHGSFIRIVKDFISDTNPPG